MLDLLDVSLQYGGKYLFENVNYKINAGDKISLVGANGTGKSSLLKIISGYIQPESGKIQKQKNISIGYLPQENIVHKGKTLLDEAMSALSTIISLQQKESEITAQLSLEQSEDEKIDLINQLGEVHHKLEQLDSYSAESNVEKILLGLGFDKEDFNKQTDQFSGGWQMRIALCKILIAQNDILLMDEPTNHLDIDSLDWLINFLKAYKGAIVIVSHDKRFINQVTTKTVEIYLRKIYTFSGNYDAYLKYKQERDEQVENQFIIQQKKIKETERFIERFRYKATKAKQVQSRIKHLEKMELVELPDAKEEINIRFPDPPSSGKVNLILNNISKSYGEKNVFKNLDFQIDRGDKIAFVGPNGAGKTTLSKIISGQTGIDSGEKIIGHNTVIAYYAQDVADSLDPSKEILDTVDDAAENKTLGQLRSLLGSFLFSGDDVFKKIGVLSGGEKSRVALVKILLTKANLIILDEPTNHLDISSKEILQKALIEFPGSLVIVSHDVDFLEPIVNKVVEIKKGSVKTFLGGIENYLSKREILGQNSNESNASKQSVSDQNRKELKRIEAELRQKKYAATKQIIAEIKKLEKEIEELELKEKEIENLLAEPSTYEDAEVSRKLNINFNEIKDALREKYKKWEELSLSLDEIEKQFS